MAEKMTVLEGEKLVYKGLFDDREFFSVIEAFLWQKGYDKRIKKNEQVISEDSKDIHISLNPWKKMSEYVKHEMKIEIAIHHAKEEIRELDGLKKKYTNGVVEISFSGYLVTDFEGRWENRPEYFFFRTVMDKWVYKIQTNNGVGAFKADIKLLKSEIEGFLNLHRFT